jgi:hypothetical protein
MIDNRRARGYMTTHPPPFSFFFGGGGAASAAAAAAAAAAVEIFSGPRDAPTKLRRIRRPVHDGLDLVLHARGPAV